MKIQTLDSDQLLVERMVEDCPAFLRGKTTRAGVCQVLKLSHLLMYSHWKMPWKYQVGALPGPQSFLRSGSCNC